MSIVENSFNIIIYGELAKPKQIYKKIKALPMISEHIGHVKAILRAKLESGMVQPHAVTQDTIAYQCRLLESEALEVYNYLKGLDLL